METRPMQPSFMDKLMRRVSGAVQGVKGKLSGKKHHTSSQTLVPVRTSPRFQGTFSPLRPFARITPMQRSVKVMGKLGTTVTRIESVPSRIGFLSAVPVMLDTKAHARPYVPKKPRHGKQVKQEGGVIPV